MLPPVQLRVIYRQAITLAWKNLLIFYKSPVSSFVKAFLLPIVITIIICFLKEIQQNDDSSIGISHTGTRISTLPQAISASNSQRLVFVTNGIQQPELNKVVAAVQASPGMKRFQTDVVDDPNALIHACKQSIHGTSDCFAAVMFNAFNRTNADYSIIVDEHFMRDTSYSYRPGQSILSKRLLPLQWALDSQIGGFASSERPTEKMWNGFFGETGSSYMGSSGSNYWLNIVGTVASPIFAFLLLNATHHMSSTVAEERESSVADLLMAQGVTTVPRVVSNMASFCILYLPGVVVSSILLGEILFLQTSTGLIFIYMLLASVSFIVSAHFMGSFFPRASVAGLCTTVLTFALGLVTEAQSLTGEKDTGQMIGLSLVFPSYAWVTLVRDIARTESMSRPFPNNTITQEDHNVNGYLFFVFFIIQILLYGAGTYLVERFRWESLPHHEQTENPDNVALELRHLRKTFKGGKQAVIDLNLDVPKHSVTFLLGPNGCGKTTVLKSVSGILKVDAGSSIRLSHDGHSFGLCPQGNVLWGVLSVTEHLRIWSKLKMAGSNQAATSDVDDVIAECNLTGKAQAAGETLSGGEKRRLQLAIAFSGGSKVCCIDEATSGLDPLSRRNIWNIIQEGRRNRTTILTTHFLDEADVLADHIAIMCKGSLVCQGSSTTLKSQYGDNYQVRVENDDQNIWSAGTSSECVQKVLELEKTQDDLACRVTFPTLEQVFLNTTSENGTTINAIGEDGMVHEREDEPEHSNPAQHEDIRDQEKNHHGNDLELDVGTSVGMLRQIWVLFRKRYLLLLQKSGMIVYAVNLLIPIIVAAALTKFMYKWPALVTCEASYQAYINPTGMQIPALQEQSTTTFTGSPGAILGPESAFSGSVQDALYNESISWMYPQGEEQKALKQRQFVRSLDGFDKAMDASEGDAGFGIWEPSPDAAIFYHSAEPSTAEPGLAAFGLLTNRRANSTINNDARHMTAHLRTMRHVKPKHDWRNEPIAILLVIAFVVPVSTAVIYPIYERVSKVRALEYSNGVSPLSLWTAYLLFDTQFIIVQALIVYGLLFVRPIHDIWYRPGCIFGAFILFGIASYLGTYLLSVIFRRKGFAAALGLHIVLFVLYFVGYIANQFGGPADQREDLYNALQYGLGLIVPAANLARALFLGMNSFDVLCGKYGDADTSYPFAYERYGSVYANLVYQILFLILALVLLEYGSAEWLKPLFFWQRRIPAGRHTELDREHQSFGSSRDIMLQRPATASAQSNSPILQVDQVSKSFGRSPAAQDVSLSISANETLALLGGNGAGKTTVIEMIRGELRPDFGDISVNGVSVLRHPRKAKLHIGVCPQDDAVDNLTVRQTLEFYAAVKGLRRIRENVEHVLNALNISSYEKVKASSLSGGTRRKLSVAIALLGNPSVLLLDEPSTGQDAGAKRLLWRALKQIRTNRALLLTTHNMEEAEALASNVAIMRTNLLVSGSLESLNSQYGGTFRIRGVRVVETKIEEVKAEVQDAFSHLGLQVMNYVDLNGLVQFFVKYNKRDLGKILSVMEAFKGNPMMKNEHTDSESGTGATRQTFIKLFDDYTLVEPTLEEVFMNVVKEAENRQGI